MNVQTGPRRLDLPQIIGGTAAISGVDSAIAALPSPFIRTPLRVRPSAPAQRNSPPHRDRPQAQTGCADLIEWNSTPREWWQ